MSKIKSRLFKETQMDFRCKHGYISLRLSPFPRINYKSNEKLYQYNAETPLSVKFGEKCDWWTLNTCKDWQVQPKPSGRHVEGSRKAGWGWRGHSVAGTQKVSRCTSCRWTDTWLRQAGLLSTAVLVRGGAGTEPVTKALFDPIWLKEAEKGWQYWSHKKPYLQEAVCLWKANLAPTDPVPEEEPLPSVSRWLWSFIDG